MGHYTDASGRECYQSGGTRYVKMPIIGAMIGATGGFVDPITFRGLGERPPATPGVYPASGTGYVGSGRSQRLSGFKIFMGLLLATMLVVPPLLNHWLGQRPHSRKHAAVHNPAAPSLNGAGGVATDNHDVFLSRLVVDGASASHKTKLKRATDASVTAQ